MSTYGMAYGGPNFRDDILFIDLKRMNQLHIDDKNMYAVLEPGVVYAQLHGAALKRGLIGCMPGGGGGNIDDFNESQVAMRMEKSVAEIVKELNTTYEQAVNVVQATPDELLAKQIRTPWQTEGELGALILDEDIRAHVMVHLADISGAIA